ncbi:hypothetical protein M0R04_12565 [Candidatus Dojkabacteria bacterium]|jgi:hypothetical protein|nr:hypothetical protein [Candidatus Dojkabacteria bacterium]
MNKQKVINVLQKVWFEEIPLDIAYDSIHLLYQKEIAKDKKQMDKFIKQYKFNGDNEYEEVGDVISVDDLRGFLKLSHKKLDKII